MNRAPMNVLRSHLWILVVVAAGCITLVGCSNSNERLRAWVAHVDAEKSGPLPPLPVVPPYHPFQFADSSLRSPFMPTGTIGHAIPNQNRPRQYLERFPLDSLSIVGTIRSHGIWYALIKDPNGLVHRVTKGNYLGQNDGKIISISTGGIQLRELMPNGTGGWASERAYLPLSLASGGQQP